MDRQICWPMTSCAQGMDCQWWCLYASRFFKALQPGQGELQVTSSNPQWSKEIQLRNFGLRTSGISHPFSHHIDQYYINCNHRHSTSSKNSTTKVNKGFLQEFWSEHHARVKCGLFVVVWGWGRKEKLSATWFRSGLGFGPAGFWSKQHYNFCWSEHRWCCGRRKAFIPFHFVLMSFDFHATCSCSCQVISFPSSIDSCSHAFFHLPMRSLTRSFFLVFIHFFFCSFIHSIFH